MSGGLCNPAYLRDFAAVQNEWYLFLYQEFLKSDFLAVGPSIYPRYAASLVFLDRALNL